MCTYTNEPPYERDGLAVRSDISHTSRIRSACTGCPSSIRQARNSGSVRNRSVFFFFTQCIPRRHSKRFTFSYFGFRNSTFNTFTRVSLENRRGRFANPIFGRLLPVGARRSDIRCVNPFGFTDFFFELVKIIMKPCVYIGIAGPTLILTRSYRNVNVNTRFYEKFWCLKAVLENLQKFQKFRKSIFFLFVIHSCAICEYSLTTSTSDVQYSECIVIKCNRYIKSS